MNIESMIKYNNQIEHEKELFKKYTLIDTGKMPSENFHVNYLPKLSRKAQDYGFLLKLTNMICALDETNRNIIRVNQAWETFVKAGEEMFVFNTMNYNIVNSGNSHIIHDIRRFIDDIISIVWVLSQNETVKNVEVDCIGKYLHDDTFNDFDEFNDFFATLNNIENAYKHSFSNNMSSLIGKDEPCIFVLDANHNKDFFDPKFWGISLKQLIREFNEFYKYAMDVIAKK